MRTWAVGTLILIGIAFLPAIAENVDPGEDGSQYAWAENVGWLNAQPGGEGGVGMQVGDAELSGWVWAENAGWISLSCKNTLSCGSVDYGVLNDGNGDLSGYAWAENLGWVNFSPSTSGVTIDPSTGAFSGQAWAENAGWISFASSGVVAYGVVSAWVCVPAPAAPVGPPSLKVDDLDGEDLLSWAMVAESTGSDIVRGDLGSLKETGGDFASSAEHCLDDDRTTTTRRLSDTPAPGEGFWFLVRGQNCGGSGTYDTGEPSQAESRDSEVAASGNDCN